MPASTWSRLNVFAFCINTAIAVSCVYLIVDEVVGRRGQDGPSGHALFQLVMLIVGNALYCAVVREVQKRHMFILAIGSPVMQFMIACETLWYCNVANVEMFKWTIKLGMGTLLPLMIATTRKLTARLEGSRARGLLTPAQKILSGGYIVIAVLMLIQPDFIVWSILEVCIVVAYSLNAWKSFLEFWVASRLIISTLRSKIESRKIASWKFGSQRHSSKSSSRISSETSDALPQTDISSSLPQNDTRPGSPTSEIQQPPQPQRSFTQFGKPKLRSNVTNRLLLQATRAERTTKEMNISMSVNFLALQLMCVCGILTSPLWSANTASTRGCHERSSDDAHYVVESARFYIYDLVDVLILVVLWKTFIFRGKRRKLNRVQGGALARHGPDSVQGITVIEKPCANEREMAGTDVVDSIIAGEIQSLDRLSDKAGVAVEWLQANFPLAYKDQALKQRIKRLLGAPRFAPNLAYFGLWDDFIKDCKVEALELGQEMQKCFIESDLGTVLGPKAVPNIYGKCDHIQYWENFRVLPCAAKNCSKRQDSLLPGRFPYNETRSQLWNEKCFMHAVRMIAMAIDHRYQHEVCEACTITGGDFKATAIKGYVRMKNKLLSKDDHYCEKYPRPGLNIDLNRNACTFETPKGLMSFITEMKAHPMFGGHPARIKNMFLYDDEEAKKQFYYRTVMVNWVFTPGITYKELAETAKGLWKRYLDFETVPGFGSKDPSESWSTWRKQINVALSYLKCDLIKNRQVHFIVETQLLLRPYLLGRQKMHLLYKVCRAEGPDALHSDFRVNPVENRSYAKVQDDALKKNRLLCRRLSTIGDINSLYFSGGTLLWKAAAQGHEMVVRELLQRSNVDPNKAHGDSHTTPLYMASYCGHIETVEALLNHPAIKVNEGKSDTAETPLFEAAQEGHEEVVAALIGANEIDVNRVTLRGYSPLSMACELGRENIVQLLLAAKSIDPNYALNDGSTAFSIAAKRGHATIIEDLLTHSRTNDLSSIAKPRTFWDGPKILSRLPKQENALEE